MKAIWGFIFPLATFRKSSSVNEKVASGFPSSYAPIILNDNFGQKSELLVISTLINYQESIISISKDITDDNEQVATEIRPNEMTKNKLSKILWSM